jgi:hypothetical protein
MHFPKLTAEISLANTAERYGARKIGDHNPHRTYIIAQQSVTLGPAVDEQICLIHCGPVTDCHLVCLQ